MPTGSGIYTAPTRPPPNRRYPQTGRNSCFIFWWNFQQKNWIFNYFSKFVTKPRAFVNNTIYYNISSVFGVWISPISCSTYAPQTSCWSGQISANHFKAIKSNGNMRVILIPNSFSLKSYFTLHHDLRFPKKNNRSHHCSC